MPGFHRFLVGFSIAALACAPTLSAQEMTREEKVRADKARVEAEGFWIYNDLEKARQIARQSDKPLLVVLRCIPCEECVKLDDDLVDNDPVLRPLLEKFVCVRIVGTNGLDLDTFQFDTDQSFAVFLLNADKTIYGRFGTRSHRTEWLGDVSLEGMARALEGALELHAAYPENKALLQGKTGAPLEFSSPEQYPAHQGKFTDRLNYEGNVAKSCIHCHQIGDARRDFWWNRDQQIPEKLMFPFPHPKVIGLVMDPKYQAKIKTVVAESPADSAGLKAGDEILTLGNQPLLSIADMQWVLQQLSPDGGTLAAKIKRGGQEVQLKLQLADGWRQQDDISWRVSSWGIRRMTAGGMVLKALTDPEKSALGIDSKMALEVNRVGQYGPHGTAKRAGFQEGDVLVALNGNRSLAREQDWFWHVIQHSQPGQMLDVELLRDGKRVNLKLPVQE